MALASEHKQQLAELLRSAAMVEVGPLAQAAALQTGRAMELVSASEIPSWVLVLAMELLLVVELLVCHSIRLYNKRVDRPLELLGKSRTHGEKRRDIFAAPTGACGLIRCARV